MAVKGVKELKGQFRDIRRGVSNAQRVAAYAGASHFRDAARQTARAFSQHGWRGIYAKRQRDGSAVAGMDRAGRAFHLVFRELGTKPHSITAGSFIRRRSARTKQIIGKALRPSKHRALAFTAAGSPQVLFRRMVTHRGQPARL